MPRRSSRTSVGPAAGEDDSPARIAEALRQYWGYDTLRPLQMEAIHAGLAARDSLVVLPTGGGKSLCYQLPPLITGKLTVVVSPLISLMKDQVDGLRMANYPAAAIHGGMDGGEIEQVKREALAGELKLLLVAPERLLTSSFLAFVREAGVGSFAIDEAHCISQWGHDFRPEYRRLAELRERMPDIALHAYTATATPRVREDIIAQLRLRDPRVLVGIFDRPNLTYRVLPRVRLDDQVEEALRRHEDRAAIVYCISRKETERLAEELSSRGLNARAYHAGLDAKTRQRVQDLFSSERLDIVVATVAFGMGIDRSDVRCVVHASMPKTVEHYQQETGRAGRDGLASECVLFYSAQDVVTWKRLMQRSAAEAEVPPEPEAIEAQNELLEHMHRLCTGARCRHRALSEYFGQRYTPPPPADRTIAESGGAEPGGCAACDVCLGELAAVDDAATVAKKIVSCVYRLRQASGMGFGAVYVADVLRGAAVAKVMQRGHDRLSTFGLLRNLDKDRIVSYINQLVDHDVLAREPGEFPTLALGTEATAVLKDQRGVALFDPRSPARAEPRRGGGDDAGRPLAVDERGMFEALRALRRAIAEERRVPPYQIFNDATLEEMCRVRPSSLDVFANIRGVGRAKLEDFGEQFVRNIGQYCREHGMGLDAAAGSRPRRRLAAEFGGSVSGAKAQAFSMFERGSAIEEVAAETGRTTSTAAQYLGEWITSRRPASVAAWVEDTTYRLIVEVAGKLDQPRYRPIFEHFGGAVTYDQIRIVMTHHGVAAAGSAG